MSIIKKLPPAVYEKIKAGEVVEDPASIIRELIDNSIDAKSKNITIEIEKGGIDLIAIHDDGIGMDEKDIEICYLPHTTSKISKFDDIFKLQSVGFRGEALASISRVSFMKILSSNNNSGMGVSLFIEGGKQIKKSAEAKTKGSSIMVKNLFYNVPVRKNFIKSPVKETRKVQDEIIIKALAYPEISFILKVNEKQVLNFKSQPWEERIYQIFKEQKDNFISFQNSRNNINVKGMISNINTTFNSTKQLYFFINNRYLKPRFLYGVINNVFNNLIPRGRYPAGVFYIYTNPREIDPNVHPSKKEVKIFSEDKIYHILYSTLRDLFFKSHSGSKHTNYYNKTSNQSYHSSPPTSEKKEITLDFENTVTPDQINSLHFKYIGQVFNTYLILEKDDELLFIDFHAAHERKRYEELKEKANKVESHKLLHPRILNLTKSEISQFTDNKEIVKQLGFDFYLFGEDSLVVSTIPVFYEKKDWEQDFLDLLTLFDTKKLKPSDLKDNLLKSIACRGSYMSGDKMEISEANLLINIVLNNEIPWSCPHGRPFVYKISKKQLASNFLRNS